MRKETMDLIRSLRAMRGSLARSEMAALRVLRAERRTGQPVVPEVKRRLKTLMQMDADTGCEVKMLEDWLRGKVPGQA